MTIKKTFGFTMFELLLVFLIIAILAGVGVPRYRNTVEKVKQRDARAILLLIKNAEEIYSIKKKAYYPTSGTVTITDINQNLNLDILEPADIDYACTSDSDFTCTATGSGWYFTVTGNTDPVCTATTGTCFF